MTDISKTSEGVFKIENDGVFSSVFSSGKFLSYGGNKLKIWFDSDTLIFDDLYTNLSVEGTSTTSVLDAANKLRVIGLGFDTASGGSEAGSLIYLNTSTSQSVNADVFSSLDWNVEYIKDPIFTHDNNIDSNKIYVNRSGVYEVQGFVSIVDVSTNSYRLTCSTRILINGTTPDVAGTGLVSGYLRGQTSFAASLTVYGIIELTAGDFIEIQTKRVSDVSGAGTTLAYGSRLGMIKIK